MIGEYIFKKCYEVIEKLIGLNDAFDCGYEDPSAKEWKRKIKRTSWWRKHSYERKLVKIRQEFKVDKVSGTDCDD